MVAVGVVGPIVIVRVVGVLMLLALGSLVLWHLVVALEGVLLAALCIKLLSAEKVGENHYANKLRVGVDDFK